MARLLLRKNNPANPPSELIFRGGGALLLRGTTDSVTSTQNLQKPVDYFMAGDLREYGRGFAPSGALRAIFNE